MAHQGGIQAVLAFKFLAQQLEIAAHGAWSAIPLRFCGGEQVGIGPTALAAMELLGQPGQLFATPIRPRGGHGGVLVVVEGAMDRSQQLGGVQIGPQLLQGPLVGISHLRATNQRWTNQPNARSWARPLQGWPSRDNPRHYGAAGPPVGAPVPRAG